MTTPRTRRLLAVVAGALAFAYLACFRAYGVSVEDEGTLLFELARILRGEVPYVDFPTGYTPGFFYLAAAMLRLAGSVPVFRLGLALVHALTVAGLVVLTGRVARPSIALIVPLVYLAFIPVFPGEFCAFNVPYAAWFATLGWVLTAAAALAFLPRRERRWLVVAGLLAAVTFAMKPNAGVFALAATATVVLLVDEPGARGGAFSALVWLALWGGVLAGVWLTLGPRPAPTEVAVFLAPIAAAMLALVARRRVRRRFVVGDAAALLVPFTAISLAWLAFFLVRLGGARFVREVLLIGSRAAELYYWPYPSPPLPSLLLAGGAAGFGALGFVLRRRRARVAPLAAGVSALVLAGGALVARLGLMPEGFTWSLIWQLEDAAFPLVLGAQLAGIAWLWRGRSGRIDPVPAALLLFALFMHLQVFPRADFMHLLMAAPFTAVVAGFLLDRALAAWEGALGRGGAPYARRVLGAAAVAVLGAAIALRLSPNVAALRAGAHFVLPFGVAPIGVERGRAGDLRDFGAAATRLAREVRRGEPSLGFPALDLALFVTGARSPTPYAYFFPGRPDHREEAEVVDGLAAVRPAALASLNRQFKGFDAAPPYYFLLRRFVRARYGLLERHGRYDVLGLGAADARAAGDAAAPVAGPLAAAALQTLRSGAGLEARTAAVRTLSEAAPAVAAPALLEIASGDDATLRRGALDALLTAIARAPADGLERYVASAGLDRRRQVLLLRTVRDTRDARAASYLFAAAASADPRVAGEALGAMEVTRDELVARRYLWAGADEPRVWPGREALVREARVTLADGLAPARAAAFAAYLAGALGDRETVPSLRSRLAAGAHPALAPDGVLADGAVTASVAAALAELAPLDLACTLTVLLARPELQAAALVPSVLLDLASGAEPARGEARRCLAEALAGPDPVRHHALWIVAALADAAFEPALARLLAAPEVEVRRGAAWALGETPVGAPSSDAALAAAARDDPEPIVRRLAQGALAKRGGTAPRAFAASIPKPAEAR